MSLILRIIYINVLRNKWTLKRLKNLPKQTDDWPGCLEDCSIFLEKYLVELC